MSVTFLQGNALEVLRGIPDESVQCVVTSPPYWGLRDYGIPADLWPQTSFVPMVGLPPVEVPEQEAVLGLEADPFSYIGHMVDIFRQIHRVLKKDGTLWVNMGDNYSAGNKTESSNRRDRATAPCPPKNLVEPCILAGTKPGDLVLDPFGGAGTTGMVADRLGREAVLIERNPEYVEMAKKRLTDDRGVLLEAMGK